MAILTAMTFILGAVAVFYSLNLFLASSRQPEEPASLRVSQWSGYFVASDVQNRSPVVSCISASWKVPRVKPSENDTFSGVWVGIGGYGEDTLIQTGTEQEYISGRSVYYAWYELLPDYLVRIQTLHVRAGDTITASISLMNENASEWLIEISDVTRGEHFEKVVVYNSSKLSAEWIVERPKVNGVVSTLADFENVTFTECTATVDNVSGTIGNFSYAQFVMHDEEISLVSVSPLNDDGSSFTVSYLEPLSSSSSAKNLSMHNDPLNAFTSAWHIQQPQFQKNPRNLLPMAVDLKTFIRCFRLSLLKEALLYELCCSAHNAGREGPSLSELRI